MSADEPEQKGKEPSRSEHGTGYHIHVPDTSAAVKDAFEKFATAYIETAYIEEQQQNRTHNSQVLSWNKATFWAVFAYTALTFCLLILSYCNLREIQSSSVQFGEAITATHQLADAAAQSKDISSRALQASQQALDRSQRAWIAPIDAQIDPETPLVAGAQKISFKVIYQNTGREPALDVNVNQALGILPVPIYFDWSNAKIPENTTCDGLYPTRGGETIYPSISTTDHEYRDVFPEIDAEKTMKELISGARIFYINGCFAYMTIGAPHQSAFCFFLAPDERKMVAKWRFVSCRTGNWAN